jgi:hypothetical protein
MDNCPHQVVLAVPTQEFDTLVARLRAESILWEDLPFARAYHTPSFEPVVAPIADFFAAMTFSRPQVPIYSCASTRRIPDDVASIRDLAVRQWTSAVAFRETIEAMHSDGLRLFVDVGARGNLAGFVEDILRGKPSFAVAANLPRRSGLAQLNHLVASLFAHGVPLNTDYLYARRRPLAIDWNAAEPPAHATVELKIGFPEMRFSAPLLASLSAAQPDDPRSEQAGDEPLMHAGLFPVSNHYPTRNGSSRHQDVEPQPAAVVVPDEPRFDALEERVRNTSLHPAAAHLLDELSFAAPEHPLPDEAAMLAFQQTMQEFLQTQQEIMSAYLGASPATFTECIPDPGEGLEPAQAAPATCDPVQVSSTGARRLVTSGPRPGPWAGEVLRVVPGHEIETRVVLSVHDDPIAHNHTLGGRKVSALDLSLKGLPVLPFAVMAEMTAQAAALAVTPGLVLTGLTQVRAHKWVRYEDEPVFIELRGRRAHSSGDERFWVGIFNRGALGKSEALRPVFEAIVIFDVATPDAPPESAWSLSSPRPSKFAARSVYEEQWLFHGPALQALSHVGDLSGDGIDGRIRVLPWGPLVKQGELPLFHTDFIVVDNFTHLLGCWGLDYLSEGDVVFPLSMDDLEIYGDRPEEGTELACRIAVIEIEHHRLRVESEILRPDGSIWMRIRDWEDWRFHWPGRYRDVMRQPRDFLLGEELSLTGTDGLPASAVKAIWLEPPADMGRPVWRDVLEQIQLGPHERATVLASVTNELKRTHELQVRIAAKEAARRLWLAAGRPSVYPADLAIVSDPRGQPRLVSLATPDTPAAAVSIACSEGVAVAIAHADPRARVGIAIRMIAAEPHLLEDSSFSPVERQILSRTPAAEHPEWISRFSCAREASANALGPGLQCQITHVDESSDAIQFRVEAQTGCSLDGPPLMTLHVASHRRADYVWAWTAVPVEGANS